MAGDRVRPIPRSDARAERELLADILASGGLTTFFQPIRDLEDGALVGYEALSRGPAGTALETPERLFGAARAWGRTLEIDRCCRHTALASAHSAGLARTTDPVR